MNKGLLLLLVVSLESVDKQRLLPPVRHLAVYQGCVKPLRCMVVSGESVGVNPRYLIHTDFIHRFLREFCTF